MTESEPREFPEEAMRAFEHLFTDIVLLFVSGLLLAFAIGYVVGVRSR
jgi:hypothetical protein